MTSRKDAPDELGFAVSTTVGAAMMISNPDQPFLVTAGLYAVGSSAFFVFFRRVPVSSAPRPAQATP